MKSVWLAVGLILWMSTGCERGPAPAPSDEEVDAGEAAVEVEVPEAPDVDVPEVDVPEASSGRLEPLPVAARLVISRESVWVDNVALVSAWSADRRRAVYRQLQTDDGAFWVADQFDWGGEKVRRADRVVVPLQEALERIRKVYDAAHPDGDMPPLAVHIDAEVPFARLVRLRRTIESAGWEQLHVALQETSDQFVALPVRAPRMSVCDRAAQASDDVCARPVLTAYDEGVSVIAMPGYADQRPCVQVAPTRGDSLLPGDEMARSGLTVEADEFDEDPRGQEWRRRLMLLDEGVCPSVPTRNSGHDLDALVELLEQIHEMEPGCAYAQLGGLPDVPWSQVAPLAETALTRTPFESLMLVFPFRTAEDFPHCEHGVRPAEWAVR